MPFSAFLKTSGWVITLTADEKHILKAALFVGSTTTCGFAKCDRVIRHALLDQWNHELESAACVSGYEHPAVASAYDIIRSLASYGLLDGRGDLALPAGPRYTECRISAAGRLALESTT